MLKILLAEDDAPILQMYSKIFRLHNFEVVTAVDGLETLDKVKSSKPDIILLDIMMPNMNGLEALDRLKKDPETSHIPVVILSNLADDHDIHTALAKGAIKYIIKSDHDPLEICQIVEQLMTA